MSAQTNYVATRGRGGHRGLEHHAGSGRSATNAATGGFVQIGAAVLPSLPSIDTRFPQLPGLDREEELQQRMILT